MAGGFVCDLFFFEPGTAVTSATGPTNADGEITVSVLTSSGLTPKFALNSDPSYASRSNTSGNFTGLLPGTYTLNCRISDSCVRTLSVTVGYVETWSPKYRISFKNVTDMKLNSRFDIEQLSYVGPVYPVTQGSDPVKISANNDGSTNIFDALIATTCIVTVVNETEGQFDEFDDFSERKYRGSYYLDGVLKWQGFLTPSVNEQPYNWKTNYDTILTFTDGIADLANEQFSDQYGNKPLTRISVLDGILFCLYKTNLRLGISETVNVCPSGIDTSSTASTLDQIYFDPLVYEQSDGTMESCESVLRGLLESLGARLMQSEGKWSIDNPYLKTSATVPTRTLASDGGTVSGANTDFRFFVRSNKALAPRITFSEQSGFKQVMPAVGKLELAYDYGIITDNNILKFGTFEDEDIVNGQLRNWQIDNTDAPFVTCEIENIPNKENSRKALKVPFSVTSGITTQQVVIIRSTPVHLYGAPKYDVKFSFDALARFIQINTDKYAEIDYSIAFIGASDTYYAGPVVDATEGTILLGPTPGPVDDLIDGIYQRVYIDTDNNWTTFAKTITVDPANLGGTFECDVQITFRITCNPLYDVIGTSVGGLVSVPTNGASDYPTRSFANRIRAKDTVGSDVFIRSYTLEGSTESSDYPNIIVPADNGVMRWNLKNTVLSPQGSPYFYECWVKDMLLDNVQIAYLPAQEAPAQSETKSYLISTNIKNKLAITFRHGSIPSDSNYSAISRGWFSKSDGSPTKNWIIRGAPPSSMVIPRTLIERVAAMYSGQYQSVRRRIYGVFDCVEVLPWIGNIAYEVRTGKLYVIVSNEISTRFASASVQMIEAQQGVPLPDITPDPDPGTPTETGDFATADFDSTDFYV